MAGQPALRHDRRVDGGLEHFRSHSRAVQIQITIAFGPCSLEHANTGFESESRNPQGFGDLRDFDAVFSFALGPKWIALNLHAVALGPELVRKERGKICRNHE